MQGKLRFHAAPGQRVAVLNAADGTPAALKTDIGSEIALGTNIVTANALGGALAYCSGKFKLTDVATAVVLRDAVDVVPWTISPMSFDGCSGLGSADDTSYLVAAIAAANTFAGLLGGGALNVVVVDGQSRKYAVSSTITIAGSYATNASVLFKDCTLVPHSSMATGVYLLETTGNRVNVQNVTLDCARKAKGFHGAAFGGMYENIKTFRFPLNGLTIDTSGGQVLDSCESVQWFSGDPEYLVAASWTGINILMQHADCRMINCRAQTGNRTQGIVQFLNGATTTQVTGCNFYNGNFMALPNGNASDFFNSKLMYFGTTVGGITFDNCYLGNGHIDIYGSNIKFNGCTAITKPTQDALTYYIGLHGDGNSPYNFQSTNWTHAGDNFGPLANGKTPFYAIINDIGTTPGDYASFLESSGGTYEMRDTVRWSRTQTDPGLHMCLYSPSDTGQTGSGIGMVDMSTPIDIWDDPPSLRQHEGGMFIYRASREIKHVTASGTTYLFVGDSGREVLVDNATAATLIMPADAYKGWFVEIKLGADSAAVVNLDDNPAFPNSLIKMRDQLGNSLQMFGAWSTVRVSCASNDDGESAIFIADGDAEFDRVTTYGNGYSYLFNNNDGVALVQNTAISIIVLPYTARVGWKRLVIRDATSTAVVDVQANIDFPASVLLNPNNGTDWRLHAPGGTQEFVCIANDDGVSAQFIAKTDTSNIVSAGTDSPTLENGQIGWKRLSNTQLEIQFLGTDSVLRSVVLTVS